MAKKIKWLEYKDLSSGCAYVITDEQYNKGVKIYMLKTHADRAITIAFKHGKLVRIEFKDELSENCHWAKISYWKFREITKEQFDKKIQLANYQLTNDFIKYAK